MRQTVSFPRAFGTASSHHSQVQHLTCLFAVVDGPATILWQYSSSGSRYGRFNGTMVTDGRAHGRPRGSGAHDKCLLSDAQEVCADGLDFSSGFGCWRRGGLCDDPSSQLEWMPAHHWRKHPLLPGRWGQGPPTAGSSGPPGPILPRPWRHFWTVNYGFWRLGAPHRLPALRPGSTGTSHLSQDVLRPTSFLRCEKGGRPPLGSGGHAGTSRGHTVPHFYWHHLWREDVQPDAEERSGLLAGTICEGPTTHGGMRPTLWNLECEPLSLSAGTGWTAANPLLRRWCHYLGLEAIEVERITTVTHWQYPFTLLPPTRRKPSSGLSSRLLGASRSQWWTLRANSAKHLATQHYASPTTTSFVHYDSDLAGPLWRA